QRYAVIGMQDGAVLYIRARADHDRIVIAAYHDVEPHRSAILEDDAADQRCVGRDEMSAAAKLDAAIVERIQHHLAAWNWMSPYQDSVLSPVLSVSVSTATPINLPGSSPYAFLKSSTTLRETVCHDPTPAAPRERTT